MNVIYHFFYFLLNTIFGFTGDWGVAVIVLTLIIRIMMLPITLKQKTVLIKQQDIAKDIETIRLKYKNEKAKMEAEIARLTQDGSKNMLGCLVTLLQVPVLGSLYTVFLRTPVQATSVIIPWVASISLPDPYFIVPALTALVPLIPNLLVSLGLVKSILIPKLSVNQIVISILLALLFFLKASVALGLYWVASGLFTTLEQIGYSIIKGRNLADSN